MKKVISWAWSLFGHRFCLEIKVGPDIKGVLKKRNRKIIRGFNAGYSVRFLAAIYNLKENYVNRIIVNSGARKPRRKIGVSYGRARQIF